MSDDGIWAALAIFGCVVLPFATAGYEAWQREKAYRKIRQDIARIGATWVCPSCGHPTHAMFCQDCGCDLMTDPDSEASA